MKNDEDAHVLQYQMICQHLMLCVKTQVHLPVSLVYEFVFIFNNGTHINHVHIKELLK